MALTIARSARADDVVVAPEQQAIKPADPPAKAESVPPADAAPTSPSPSVATYPTHVWDLPAISVEGPPASTVKEEERVGDYGQPRWTTQRRFPTTRIYVAPAGKVEFEYWNRYTAPFKDPGRGREVRSYYEMEFGLGHRLQLDVYLVTEQAGQAAFDLKREQIELRYALADWGKIWGNPTLYLEWQRRHDENDRLEGKLLLGGEVAPRIHAGFNAVLEREIGGESENEYNLTGGLSYALVDSVFSIGAEGYVEVHDFRDHRVKFSDTEQLFLAGPSFMVNPIPPARILFAPLFGSGQADGADGHHAVFRLWLVAGWMF